MQINTKLKISMKFVHWLSSSPVHPVSHSDSTDSSKSIFKSGLSISELSHDISSSMPQSAFVNWDFRHEGYTPLLQSS